MDLTYPSNLMKKLIIIFNNYVVVSCKVKASQGDNLNLKILRTKIKPRTLDLKINRSKTDLF